MFLKTCFKSTVPGYKSPGEVIAILGSGILKYRTLHKRILDKHSTVRHAIKDPSEPRFWIIPDADVKLLGDECAKIKALKKRGYSVSVTVAEKKLELSKGLLLKKDIGQQRILSVWSITRKMFQRLQKMGKRAIVALPNMKEDLLARAGAKNGDKPVTGPSDEWLDSWKVRSTAGALRPYAYASRVGVFVRRYKKSPDWAKKENGYWLFRRDYIEADAQANLKYIGVAEMARILACSARAVINWIDDGRIPCEGRSPHDRGNERIVLREKFILQLPLLRPKPKLSEAARKQKRKLARCAKRRKQKLAKESVKIEGEIEACGFELDEIGPKEDALREEHRCGRVGTLYLGKKPRGEKVIVRELNILHGRCEEAEYNQFRLRLKLPKKGAT